MTRHDELLRLAHSSMKVTATLHQARSDWQQLFAWALDVELHALSCTEAPAGSHVRRELKRAAHEAGWNVAPIDGGDCAVALAPGHELLHAGYVHVLDAQLGMPAGNYGRRGVGEATWLTPARNMPTLHVSHWLTAYKLDGQPGGETRRERRHQLQTEAMIERVQLHGRGRALSFFAGDTNVDEERDHGRDRDAPHARFTAAGLVTAWDELRPGERLPKTHGGAHGPTIDVIGRYQRDTRVSCVRTSVVPFPGRFADHEVVTATYRIKP